MIKFYSFLILAIVFASNVIAQKTYTNIPTNGLVFWMPFNNSCDDESGNKIKNQYNNIEFVSDRNNKANSAILMNGINSKITLIDPIMFYSDKRKEYSISLWINSNFESGNTILSGAIRHKDYNLESSTKFESYNIMQLLPKNRPYEDSSILSFALAEQSKHNNISSKANWKNITIIKNKNKLSFYIDSKINFVAYLDTTISNDLNYKYYGINQSISKDDLFINLIGAIESYNPPTKSTEYVSFYNGYLDDIAIYNRALTEQEIKQLYEGCPKETAISSSFNYPAFITGKPVSLIAEPQGGVFKGVSVENNQFVPAKAKIGTNKIQYNFKNSNGCNDSTLFSMIVADTVGNTCVKYDTILKIKFKLTTGIKANQYTSLLVYPNPTSDVLVLELSDLDALKAYKYRIMDLLGKEVYNAPITSMKTEIPLKTLGAKGMYVLHILDANNVSIQAKQIVLE